jgi:hypothetical protein
MAEVLGGEPRLGTARGRVLDQDRLQVGLRDVADQARAGELVVRFPGGVGTPSTDPADLLARDGRAEHRVADELVRRGVRLDLILDAEVAEDLHRPLVGDVRPRRVGGPAVLGDHDVRHVQAGEAQRGRAPGRPGPDDEHVGFRGLSGWDLGLGESVVEGRHAAIVTAWVAGGYDSGR